MKAYRTKPPQLVPKMFKDLPPEPDSFDEKTSRGLKAVDNILVQRFIRVANHIPAFVSLAYFGLISMTMMNMEMNAAAVTTFKEVITRAVGPTSNAAFSSMFPTLVTPASFVFLIWPVISVLQLFTLVESTFFARRPLSQSDLTALSLSNACATAWLIVSSNSAPAMLSLWSCLTLPFVPLFSGFPLRQSQNDLSPIHRPVFQIFSSFTTIASFLALAVELQHGNRLTLLYGRPEVAACVFVAFTAGLVSLPNRSYAKRTVNLLALTGILGNRLMTSGAGGGLVRSLLSASFIGTLLCWGWAVKKLVKDGSPLGVKS